MPTELDSQLLRSVPKVVLHEHLDGGLRLETVIRAGQRPKASHGRPSGPGGLVPARRQPGTPA
jgi:hypothetical protein